MLVVNCKSISVSVNENDMAYRYFNDIRRYKQLTEEQQKDLLYIVKNGDDKESIAARQKLIETNQRIVASVAKHLSNGDNFNDLVSEGTIGLNKAIDKYNLDFKQHFITYAVYWINKYIVDYLIGDDKFIVPKNANKVYAYVTKVKNNFFLENCRYPTPEELQSLLREAGIIFSNKDDLIQPVTISVDEIDPDYTDKDDSEIFRITLNHEYNDATSTNDIEAYINKEHIKSIVERYLSYLTDKQRYIVSHYHGIGCLPETFQMIANTYQTETRNISREYNSAITKIRKRISLQNSIEK